MVRNQDLDDTERERLDEEERERETRTSDPRDERYDEHRFSQEGDDHAGRSWNSLASQLDENDVERKPHR